MHGSRWLACVSFLLALTLGAQQDTQKRDLKIVPDETPLVENLAKADGTPVTIPRSYALVVGIANYKNLPDKSLKFSERDVEAIYSILISPEGGNFRAQNVHILNQGVMRNFSTKLSLRKNFFFARDAVSYRYEDDS